MLSMPPRLVALQGINAYSTAGAEAKAYFHSAGKKFLREVAKELDLPKGTFEVRSNMGGIAVSGEVTLHSDTLYVQLSESCMRPGVDILFRSCRGRKDYSGGMNHWSNVRTLGAFPHERERFIESLKRLGGLTV